MAYRELKYYRRYPLEIREYGDTGWAVHVYPPADVRSGHKVAVLTTPMPAKLAEVLADARRTVDRHAMMPITGQA
ncbi:hypothetical protein [Roseomonas sp. KE0001]|uniref:hypothetical protein n=1 Tax=Roseomonas sp. KE0001 TaxID=2479201 RepID=UPI0018DEF210|nr:hypothetical protein [Roseomonas sp. KE0001]MBI0435440.1 hypothetical protein [Roseomonas sp. KE0001]